MGKLKALITDTKFETTLDINSKEFCDFFEKQLFVNSVDKILSDCSGLIDMELEHFFNAIIYKDGTIEKPYRLSVYGKKESEKYMKWCTYQELLKCTSVLKDYTTFNLYYLPLPFKKRSPVEKNAGITQCFYIDIDGIYLNLSGETHEERRCEIMELLMNEYNVPYESLPPFVVCSGHGLHLYYTIPPEPADEEHKEKVKRVCAYFNGDFSGVSPAHIIRVPNSYNAKKEPVRSELFVINEPEYSWDYITPIMANDDETNKVYKAYKDEKNEKRRRTLEAKKIRKERDKKDAERFKTSKKKTKKEKVLNRTKNEVAYVQQTKEKITTMPTISDICTDDISDEVEDDDYDADILIDCFSEELCASEINDVIKRDSKVLKKPVFINYNYQRIPLNRNTMFGRRITDLLNYYYRRNGKIDGYRNIFFTIFVHTLKAWGFTEDKTEERCLDLIEPDFEAELHQIIKKAYSNSKTYKFTNETIAELLNFQEYDYEQSYSTYREQDRLERERLRGKKRYEATKVKNKVSRALLEQAVIQNSHLKLRELAEMLGISIATASRIRNKKQSEH